MKMLVTILIFNIHFLILAYVMSSKFTLETVKISF